MNLHLMTCRAQSTHACNPLRFLCHRGKLTEMADGHQPQPTTHLLWLDNSHPVDACCPLDRIWSRNTWELGSTPADSTTWHHVLNKELTYPVLFEDSETFKTNITSAHETNSTTI